MHSICSIFNINNNIYYLFKTGKLNLMRFTKQLVMKIWRGGEVSFSFHLTVLEIHPERSRFTPKPLNHATSRAAHTQTHAAKSSNQSRYICLQLTFADTELHKTWQNHSDSKPPRCCTRPEWKWAKERERWGKVNVLMSTGGSITLCCSLTSALSRAKYR